MKFKSKEATPETLKMLDEAISCIDRINKRKTEGDTVLLSCSMRNGSVARSTIRSDYDVDDKKITKLLKKK